MPKDLPNADFSIKVIQGEPVQLPVAEMIMDASFSKDGADLVIEHNGQNVTVEGYFNGLNSPDLIHESGIKLSPDMVNSFVKTAHAGKYAQAGSVMNDASPVGQIIELVGDVVITRADGTEVIAEIGTVIHQGDVIETSADGAANILFADSTSFSVSEDARLSVDEFKYDSDAQEGSSFFSMLKGAFVYTSGMIGKDDPGNVNIETPAGSIGIRGTVVMGKIDPSGQNSEITIIDGAVVITNAGGSVELNDMFETARLNGYDQSPQNIGQMTADYVQGQFKSLGDVARDTFGQSFNRSNDGEGNQPSNDAPSSNDAPETLSNDGQQDASAESQTQTVEAPQVVTTAQQPAPVLKPRLQQANTLKTQNDTSGAQDSTQPPPPPPTGTTAPTLDLRPVNTSGNFRIKEFEDFGFNIGRIEAFGTLANNVTYSLVGPLIGGIPGAMPFEINQNTGVIRLSDPGQLNASDLADIVKLNVKVTSQDGTFVIKPVEIRIDNLLPDAAPRFVLSAGDDDYSVSAGIADDVIVYGGDGNDGITDLGDGNNFLIGGRGNDDITIELGAGGNKRVFGGAGNDTITDNSEGNSILDGGAGDDNIIIENTDGHEMVFGGAGNDKIKIYEQHLDDQIDGGAGRDELVLHLDADAIADTTFDYKASTTQNVTSIEKIFLTNDSSGYAMTLNIDGGTVHKMAGFNSPVLEVSSNLSDAGITKLYLEGNWERLTAFDGLLKDANNNLISDSAVFRHVGTQEYVVTHTASDMIIQEGGSGNYSTVDTNTDAAPIPELQPFL